MMYLQGINKYIIIGHKNMMDINPIHLKFGWIWKYFCDKQVSTDHYSGLIHEKMVVLYWKITAFHYVVILDNSLVCNTI